MEEKSHIILMKKILVAQLLKYGLEEDEEAMRVFLKTNQNEVHDPRYGYSISNFKNRGHSKVYPPNRRHVDRVYCLKKII